MSIKFRAGSLKPEGRASIASPDMLGCSRSTLSAGVGVHAEGSEEGSWPANRELDGAKRLESSDGSPLAEVK